jgi:uncharacterized protein DUF6895
MRAIGWLEENIAWFDPAVWNEMLPARAFAGGPLLELLVLCDNVPCRGLTEAALDLADRLTASPEFRAGLYRGDVLFTYHLWLLVLMDRLGASRPHLLAAAQSLLDAGVRPTADGVAALELRHVVDLGGLASPHLPSAARLYRRWRAGQHLDPFRLTGNECYALTHAVFYATSFGRAPLPPDAELVRATRLLLAAHLETGDLDLGAELCHTALLVDGPDGLAAAHHRIATAARPDGAVPGPLHNPATLARASGRKAEAYLFGTCYHTTVVTALALAAWPDPAPDEPDPADPVARLSADLVVAVRQRDLGRTATLLLTAARESRSGPVISAARTFLRTQRQPDGAFGIPADPELTALCASALDAETANT